MADDVDPEIAELTELLIAAVAKTTLVPLEGKPITPQLIEQAKERILYGKILPRCAHCQQLEKHHMPDKKCPFLPTHWELL